jgi:hypothetical protein
MLFGLCVWTMIVVGANMVMHNTSFNSMTQIGKRCGLKFNLGKKVRWFNQYIIKKLQLILGMQKRVTHWYILPLCCSISKFLIALIFRMWTPKDNMVFCYECHEPTSLLLDHQWLLDEPTIQALCLWKEPPN